VHGPAYLSPEEDASLSEGAPSFASWSTPRDNAVKVTVDMARDESMKQLVDEIKFLDDKLKASFHTRKPKVEDLLEVFFGEESEIFRVFKKYLPNCNFDRYTRWLTTYLVCAAYGKSIEDLYSECSFIDKAGLASAEEYKRFWQDISVACLDVSVPGKPRAKRDVKPFWLHVQEAINMVLGEWCVEGYTDGSRKKKMVVDDDKLHFETAGSDEENATLGKSKHVTTNCWGFVVDSLVHSVSGLPAGFSAHKKGDSSESQLKDLVLSQLCPGAGANTPNALVGTSIDADRGYWRWMVLRTFMGLGAMIEASTLMRQHWSPFMYDQESAHAPNRVVSKAGHKALYRKTTNVGNRPLTVVAYRNGNGGVTLGISTVNSQNHYDCVLKCPSDIEWHKLVQNGDRRAMRHKWYQRFNMTEEASSNRMVTSNNELVAALSDTDIEPIITECNNSGWFLCQSNADTSSVGEKSVRVVFSTPTEDLDAAGISGTYMEHLEAYLSPWIQRAEGYVLDEVDTGVDVNRLQTGDAEYAAETAERVQLEQGDANYLSDDNVRRLLYTLEIGMHKANSHAEKRDRLKEWILADQKKQPYIGRSQRDLALEFKQRTGKKVGNKSAATLVNELMKKDDSDGGRPILLSKKKLRQRLLAASIESTFLKKLAPEQKEYCKMGHEAEEKFMQQLLRDSGLDITKINILDAYCVGLVAKKGKPNVKDSIDFIVVCEDNGERKVYGIKMKARVTGATQQASLSHARSCMIHNSRGTPDAQQNKYVETNAVLRSNSNPSPCIHI